MAKERVFKSLSEIEHILERPNMYIGSIDEGEFQEYVLENGKFEYKSVKYVPGFVKIINEVIDNSTDEYIRSNGKASTKIWVSFKDDIGMIICEDNGRGIPVDNNEAGDFIPFICWGKPRAGENFESDRETIGMNGLGAYAANVFSKKFIGETCDGKKKSVLTFTDNASNHKISTKEYITKDKGVKVSFEPDLERFGLQSKDVFSENTIYKQIIYQRLLNLSICYPGITFIFDGKQIKTNNLKHVLSLFGEEFEYISSNNCLIGIYPNLQDEFRYFSYMNGLKLPSGGSHIDIISNDIVNGIREKLSKKYKTIKPGEIKSKLFVVVYGWNFKNPKFDSQTKERLTNSTADIRSFLNGIDLDKLIKQCLKNNSIIDPIVEIYKIKEEFANRKKIEGLVSPKRKVVSKKYLPATMKQKYLILGEGESAVGTLSSTFGREEFGFFEMRGKPISAEKASLVDFLANEEMKLLMNVLETDFSKKPEQTELIKISYDYIVLGTDQDFDGMHIRGLLLSMFRKYVPHLLRESRILQLRTPIIVLFKGDKMQHFFFTIDEFNIWQQNNDVKKYKLSYYKGLGSWNSNMLEKLIKDNGKDNFFVPFIFDESANETILDWFVGDRVDVRKQKLTENEFSLTLA